MSSEKFGIDWLQGWYTRKQVADRDREPLYVTPEEYQELREWAAHEEEERERRYGPQMFKFPSADEARSSHDALFGTQVVVDRAERDRQMGAEKVTGPNE